MHGSSHPGLWGRSDAKALEQCGQTVESSGGCLDWPTRQTHESELISVLFLDTDLVSSQAIRKTEHAAEVDGRWFESP